MSLFSIARLSFESRLIQAPLAGYSCAPYREMFRFFMRPAFTVSEMISAFDVLHKHSANSRYLYRAPDEPVLSYQLAGACPKTMAMAALKLYDLGADLIDVNCGCPKAKIRKKGYGSALLESPDLLIKIIDAMRQVLPCPLTVKMRIGNLESDIALAKKIESSGVDAMIIHGRRWMDDYDVPCDFNYIAEIKKSVGIPVIVNGDITNAHDAAHALSITGCDALMIGRAATGRPWIYQHIEQPTSKIPSIDDRTSLFMAHIEGLSLLESEFKAVLQSRSLFRYYFREWRDRAHVYNQFVSLNEINEFLSQV